MSQILNVMKIKQLLFLPLLISIACSSTRTVTMNSMRPAEITFPSDINTLLILDRSMFEKKGINIIEGILTGELPGEDKAGAQALMSSFQNQLTYSPRFNTKVAEKRMAGNSLTSAFPDQIPWAKVNSLCSYYQTEALVSLEIFDSDFVITKGVRKVKKKVKDGDTQKEIEVDEYYAEGVGTLVIGIRLYDPKEQSIVDQQLLKESNTWSAVGTSATDAAANLIDKSEATRYLGRQAGIDYAYKIAPMPVRITRSFYGKSKKAAAVEQGTRFADVAEWQKAADIWRAAIPTAGDKEAGMLAYNAAIAFEVLGDMEEAKKWAQTAYVKYGNKDGRTYLNTLSRRLAQEEQAKLQLN